MWRKLRRANDECGSLRLDFPCAHGERVVLSRYYQGGSPVWYLYTRGTRTSSPAEHTHTHTHIGAHTSAKLFARRIGYKPQRSSFSYASLVLRYGLHNMPVR